MFPFNNKKVVVSLFSLLFSQEVPSSFYQYKNQLNDYDLGKNWNFNSNISSIRFQDINSFNKEVNPDSLNIDMRLGVFNLEKSTALYGFGRFQFKNYLYGYLYPRIINNSTNLNGFSGVPREISTKLTKRS